MIKTLIGIFLMLFAMPTMADYQTAKWKSDTCEWVGQAAQIQVQYVRQKNKAKVEEQLKSNGTPEENVLACVLDPAAAKARKMATSFKTYNLKDAYMDAWAYCMDNLEPCASSENRKQQEKSSK